MPATRIALIGTNTDVGKSHVGRALARTLVARGRRVAAFKPFESGWDLETSDAKRWQDVCNLSVELDDICPWKLPRPVTPAEELIRLDRSVTAEDIAAAADRASHADADVLFIETAGGVGSPVTPALDSVDLVRLLDARPILVTANELGTISTTCAAIALCAARGVQIRDVIINARSERQQGFGSNARWIETRTGARLHAFSFDDGAVNPTEALHKLVEVLNLT